MSRSLRFASWNLDAPSDIRLTKQIEFLQTLECDAVALQEAPAARTPKIREFSGFPWCLQSLDLRPRQAGETSSRDRGCVLLASERFELLSPAEILWDAAAPERTLVARFGFDGGELSIASFHQVAGGDRKWGSAKKRQTFDAICGWMAKHPTRTIVGMDVNSPELDHPEIARNVYFRHTTGDQHEHLLHDPEHATHELRDAFRVHLERNPGELERIVTSYPEGPLAISHRNQGRPRRFDYIYLSPDLNTASVSYLTEETLDSKLSNHALVIADLELVEDAYGM